MDTNTKLDVSAIMLNENILQIETRTTGFINSISCKQIDLEEKILHEVLVKRGWTPPKQPQNGE